MELSYMSCGFWVCFDVVLKLAFMGAYFHIGT